MTAPRHTFPFLGQSRVVTVSATSPVQRSAVARGSARPRAESSGCRGRRESFANARPRAGKNRRGFEQRLDALLFAANCTFYGAARNYRVKFYIAGRYAGETDSVYTDDTRTYDVKIHKRGERETYRDNVTVLLHRASLPRNESLDTARYPTAVKYIGEVTRSDTGR